MSLSQKTRSRIRRNKFLRAVPGRMRQFRSIRTVDDYFRVFYPPQSLTESIFRPCPLLNLVRREGT